MKALAVDAVGTSHFLAALYFGPPTRGNGVLSCKCPIYREHQAMLIRKAVIRPVFAGLLLSLASCASDPGKTKRLQQSYESAARVHDEFAKEMRVGGNDVMAEYHEQEAARARHNEYAADCGFISTIIFGALLDSDACVNQ